jgi:hypothetical protein
VPVAINVNAGCVVDTTLPAASQIAKLVQVGVDPLLASAPELERTNRTSRRVATSASYRHEPPTLMRGVATFHVPPTLSQSVACLHVPPTRSHSVLVADGAGDWRRVSSMG